MKSPAAILPPSVELSLQRLGANLRTARLRRNLTQGSLADRAFISIPTLRRLENGDGGVSLTSLASVLLALDMEQKLAELVEPGQDTIGQAREARSRRQRASGKKR